MHFSFQEKLLITFLIVFSLPLTRCKQRSEDPVTFNLQRSDFVEKIRLQGTIQAVNNATVSAPRTGGPLFKVIYLAKEGSIVKKGDTVCILSSTDLLSAYESMRTTNEATLAELKKLEAENAFDLSVLTAKVETNKAQMEISMLDSVQKKFAPPVKQQLIALELERSQIEQDKLLKQLNSLKRIDASELASLRSRIKMNENRLQQYADQINALTLLSPADGLTVHFVAPTLMMSSSSGGTATMGGKIEEGSSVFINMGVLQIPVMNEMQVSIEASEADYKRIVKGQRVEIEIDAVNNLFTTGKVRRKSVVGKQVQREFAVKTYEVIVSIDSCHSRMTPGLSASCEIFINEESDVVVVPAVAVFEKDSSKFVYVEKAGSFIRLEVETGLTNSTEIIVTKGLTGDETIAITEPSHKLLTDKTINTQPEN